MAENGPIEIGVRVDTDQAARSIQNFSKQSRTALTSLSLVLQDLPFGFIGIQNNLPALIQTFGELQTTSGGTRGALVELGKSLIGPSGLFLAFSAVTAGVTFLVQEYGSLGNAIEAIFSKNEKLTLSIQEAAKSYKEFEKGVRDTNDVINQESATTTGQIARVEALSNVIKNSNTSYENRKKAISDLQDINKDFFGSLNAEKLNFEELEKAVTNYTASIVQAAVTKGFEQDIVSANKELVTQEKLLKNLSEQVNIARAAPIQIQGIEGRREDLRLIKEAESRYNAQKVVVDNLKSSIKSLNTEIFNSVTEQVNLQKNVDNATESLKKQGSAVKGPEVDKEWERMQGLIAQSNQRLAEYYAKQLQIQADKNLQNKLKADAEAYKLLEQSILGANEANAEFGIGLQNQIQAIDTTYANATIATGEIIQRFRDAQMSGANEFTRLQEQVKNLNNIKSSIEENLTRPFRDFFDELLTNGKVSFDSFVELAKDAFQRILAQAIASGIANLIAAALSGGGTLALGKLGAAKGIAATLSGLGKVGGLFGTANFGGVQGAPMQMAGAVNLTLRGSDLVGSINRTNATINRIG
jgi:hypothetical protein